MIINCGLFKTGSTGTYNIVRVALEKNFNISALGFKVELWNVDENMFSELNIVKTHIFPLGKKEFLQRIIDQYNCKFICTIRDPRGAASSYYAKDKIVGPKIIESILDSWNLTYNTLHECDRYDNILFIDYHDLVNHYDDTIKRILDFIELDWDDDFIEMISDETHPLKYKSEVTDKIENFGDWDETTLLHKNHISGDLDLDGTKWKEMPADLQLKTCEELRVPILKYRYDTPENLKRYIESLT